MFMKISAGLSLVLLLLAGCSDKLPLQQLQRAPIEFRHHILTAEHIQDTTQFVPAALGQSRYLQICNNPWAEAQAILKFNYLLAFNPTRDTLRSLKFKIYSPTDYRTQGFQLHLARIVADSLEWDEDSVATDLADLSTYSRELLVSVNAADQDTLSNYYYWSMTLPLSLMTPNSDTTHQISCSVILTTDAQEVVRLYATESIYDPMIEIEFTRWDSTGDSSRTLTVKTYPTEDVSLAEYHQPDLLDGRLLVNQGRAYRPLLRFDLTPVLDDTSRLIAAIWLHLYPDPLNPNAFDEEFSLAVLCVDTSDWNNTAVEPVLNRYNYQSGITVRQDDSSLVVKIIDEIGSPAYLRKFELLLQSEQLSTLSFYGTRATETVYRPWIEVVTMKEELE